MEERSGLELMVDEGGVNRSIDVIAETNSPISTQELAPLSLYQKGKRVLSQIKAKVSRGARRAVLATTLAGVLAACSVAAFYSHTNSSGVKVAYPPDFSCYSIASDFGSYYNPEGTKRTWSAPHTGLDLFGDTVIAAANGRVIFINDHLNNGHEVIIIHTPKDLGRDVYAFTWYVHLKEDSSRQYIKVGDDVVAGQRIAEVGKSGKNLEYTGAVAHLHFEIWTNKDGRWRFRTDGTYRWLSYPDGSRANPHDFWAKHPLDKPGEVKYIPFSNGEKYGGGFVFPIKCPLPKKKSGLDMGGSNILLGLDLDRIREEITERIIYSPNGNQFKKAA